MDDKNKNLGTNEGMPTKWFRLKLRTRLQLRWWKMASVGFMKSSLNYAEQHKLKFASLVMVGMLTLSGAVGAYAYSNDSVTVLHPLYPLKKSLESAELYLAYSPKDRARIHLKQAMKRLAEAEILQDQMEKSTNPENETDGIDETFADMQEHMTQSLANGNDETDVREAAELVQNIKHDFTDVNRRVSKFQERFSGQNQIAIMNKIQQIKSFTEQKALKAQEDEEDLQQIILDRPRRGLLKHLGDDTVSSSEQTLETL